MLRYCRVTQLCCSHTTYTLSVYTDHVTKERELHISKVYQSMNKNILLLTISYFPIIVQYFTKMRTAIFIPTDMITVWSPVDVSKLPNNNLQKYISKYKVGR